MTTTTTTATKEKTKRTPRFKRVANKDNVIINDRDVEIITQVHRHRFLTSAHITALVEGSQQNIVRRLGLLYHAGYLDRPREQISRASYGQPLVYGLGNKGAAVLAEHLDLPRAKVDWTTKNREVGSVFLSHTLMTANFMVCLDLACRKRGLTVVWPDDVLEEMPPRNVRNGSPFKVDVTVPKNGQDVKIAVVPDAVFGLEEKDGTVSYFFLEADCSTMPIVRASFEKSSYYKKLVGYWAAKESGRIKDIFGWQNPRVLTLAISKDRINNMIAANKEMDPRKTGFRLFYFALARNFTVDNPDAVFDSIWLNGRAEPCRLLD